MSEREHLERAIAALEAQRAVLGDEVVETALTSLREKLASQQQTAPQPDLPLPAERAASRSDDRVPAGGLSETALRFADLLARHRGDPEEARRYFEQWLRLSRENGSREGQAASFTGLGSRALYLGEYAAARAGFEQALEIWRQVGDRPGESEALAAIGQLACLTGNLGEAEVACQAALGIAREIGSLHRQADALTYLAHAQLSQGRLGEAYQAYQEALTIRRTLGQDDLAVNALAGLARVELARRAVQPACAWVEQILEHLRQKPDAGMDEPALIYLTCCWVLGAAGDRRAQAVLESGYAWLTERAARIGEADARRSFLESVPAHRQLSEEWERSNLEE